MPGKKGGGKSRGEKRTVLSARLVYTIFWLLGFGVLFLYTLALFLERTAPVHPVTGFHISVSGAMLYLAYPAVTGLQTILLLVGFWLLLMGMVGNRKWVLPGLGVFLLGCGFLVVNYLVSL